MNKNKNNTTPQSIPHLLIQGSTTHTKYEKIRSFLWSHVESTTNICFLNCAHIPPDQHKELIQTQVQLFSQIRSFQSRFVVFDHATFLSLAAQSILRRYIEQYSRNVRFVFIVSDEHSGSLISPILSRLYKVYIGSNHWLGLPRAATSVDATDINNINNANILKNLTELRESEETEPNVAAVYEWVNEAYHSAIVPQSAVSLLSTRDQIQIRTEKWDTDFLFWMSFANLYLASVRATSDVV